MDKIEFPKSKILIDAELEAWKYVFEKLESLENRIKSIEDTIKLGIQE